MQGNYRLFLHPFYSLGEQQKLLKYLLRTKSVPWEAAYGVLRYLLLLVRKIDYTESGEAARTNAAPRKTPTPAQNDRPHFFPHAA